MMVLRPEGVCGYIEDPLVAVIRNTDSTLASLADNLHVQITDINPMLDDWNNSHVVKYLQVSEEITQTIQSVMENLGRISVLCEKRRALLCE